MANGGIDPGIAAPAPAGQANIDPGIFLSSDIEDTEGLPALYPVQDTSGNPLEARAGREAAERYQQKIPPPRTPPQPSDTAPATSARGPWTQFQQHLDSQQVRQPQGPWTQFQEQPGGEGAAPPAAAPAPPPAPPPTEHETTLAYARQFQDGLTGDPELNAELHQLRGMTDAALRQGINYLPNALNSAIDFMHRNVPFPFTSAGKGLGWRPIGTLPAGQAERDFWQSNLMALKEIPGATELTTEAKDAYAKVDAALGNGPFRQAMNNTVASVGDILDLIPGLALRREALSEETADIMTRRLPPAEAEAAAANRRIPIWRLNGFSSPDAALAEGIGFRNGHGNWAFTHLALGMDEVTILTNNNLDVGNIIAHHVSGVPFDSYLSAETLDRARQPMERVLDRAADGLPTGPLDATARMAIEQAGSDVRISRGSPDVQDRFEKLRQQLADPDGNFNGKQVMGELRALRQEGFKELRSDDTDVSALGRIKLRMANAIEGHIDRNLDPDFGVDINRVRAARQALAQNFAVAENLQGNDLDLASLGRAYSRESEAFSGPLRTAAIFAENNGTFVGRRIPRSEVARRAARAGHLNLTEPATWPRVAQITGIPQAQVRRSGVWVAQQEFRGYDPRVWDLPQIDTTFRGPPGRAWEQHQFDLGAPGGVAEPGAAAARREELRMLDERRGRAMQRGGEEGPRWGPETAPRPGEQRTPPPGPQPPPVPPEPFVGPRQPPFPEQMGEARGPAPQVTSVRPGSEETRASRDRFAQLDKFSQSAIRDAQRAQRDAFRSGDADRVMREQEREREILKKYGLRLSDIESDLPD